MPAVSLSRVVKSGPGGQDLAPGTWQRLEAVPDPRSPRGRIYPLACLIAIALCAFTAAGNDRLTAVGQWVRRAGQDDLARLRAPWDPLARRYRAPDEKTIRVVLDRLDPRAQARALPGSRQGHGGPPAASVRRARQAAQQVKALARDRLRAVAVDGKTSRGARRADGTRVHLLGVAGHGGHLLDHVGVGVKHNETSHFTEFLEPVDLAGVPRRPPGHHDHPPAGGRHRGQDLPPGRLRRHQPDQHARHRAGPGPPGPRAPVRRGPPSRDVAFGEDAATSRTGSGPASLATIRAAVITAIKRRLHIPEGRRDHTTPAETLRLHGFD